ncbi:hypothetical protein Peur_048181 [Populus x canadensis]
MYSMHERSLVNCFITCKIEGFTRTFTFILIRRAKCLVYAPSPKELNGGSLWSSTRDLE